MPGLETSALVSLAIVKVNWDKGGRGYADSFTPFVVMALVSCGSASGPAMVRDRVREDFGIRLPENVVLNLLERGRHDNLVKANGHRMFTPTQEAEAAAAAAREERVRLARRRNQLISLFIEDAREVGVSLEPSAAESVLLGFIELHSAPLLAGILRGDVSGVPRPESESDEFLAARYIVRVLEREPEVADYLADVVKGCMLAAALYSTNTGDVQRRFRSTRLFLDTPLLLKALGHEGDRAALPVVEMIALARESDAEVACFEHSLHEIEGVLHGVADVLATGVRPPAVRGVLSHYLAINASSSDVLEKVGTVEDGLALLGVRVAERPSHDRDLTVDELELRAVLTDRVHYANAAAADHDIDSLTSIHRIRGGRRVEQIERCAAILVTDNAGLVGVSSRFFRKNEGASIGPAILDHNLTTLLWAKSSQGAPNLPLNQIVADAYAVLSPGPAMWRAYMDQIDQLQARGEVSLEEVTELRFSTEAHRTIVAGTGGDSKRLTKNVVLEALTASRRAASEAERVAKESAEAQVVVERARANSLAATAGDAEAEASELRDAVRRLEDRDSARHRAIGERARRQVHRWMRVALAVVLVVGVASVVAPVLWHLPSPLALSLRIVGVLLALLSLATLVLGGSVKAVADKLEGPLAERRAARVRRGLYLQDDIGDGVGERP